MEVLNWNTEYVLNSVMCGPSIGNLMTDMLLLLNQRKFTIVLSEAAVFLEQNLYGYLDFCIVF